MDFKKEDMNKLLKYIPWVIAAILAILMVRGCGQTPEKEYITVETVIEVPSIKYVFDTIYEPVPVYKKVKEIDSIYYKEYKKLKDSVKKDSMFKKAIEINEYTEKFEDTLQTIDVYSKTRGKLLEQTVKYTTKPYYITVKDSVEIKRKTILSVGAEIGVPTIPTLSTSPVLKGNVIITNKRGNSISASYDTEGRVWVGKTWKIRLRK
tara:strand:- start:33330 stop:33950 length:621 start_codon:yes stop_codon:yes gene_type:complete